METANVEVRTGEVIVTLDGQDIRIPMDSLGVTIDSNSRDILAACRAIIQENQGIDISDESGEFSFGVRKAMNSNTVYVYPKPVAG